MALPQVVVLNGGSSSGKSTLARALQRRLPGTWLAWSIDDLVAACPPALLAPGGLDIGQDGGIDVGAAFTAAERQWMAGIAAMAHAGARVVVDDAFLSGPPAQARWRAALDGLAVAWLGVHLDPDVAARREAARGDRTPGMAARQALAVHVGIDYDVQVDSASASPDELAEQVARALGA